MFLLTVVNHKACQWCLGCSILFTMFTVFTLPVNVNSVNKLINSKVFKVLFNPVFK